MKVVRAIEGQKVIASRNSLFSALLPALSFPVSLPFFGWYPSARQLVACLFSDSTLWQTDMRDRPVAGVKIVKVRPPPRATLRVNLSESVPQPGLGERGIADA